MACFARLFITRGERKLPYRTQASRASPVVLCCLRIRPSLTHYIIYNTMSLVIFQMFAKNNHPFHSC